MVGISSASEEFQSRIQEALDGVANIADDILLFGLGDTPDQAEAEHDRNFLSLLDRADNRNLKLNANKLQFKRPRIAFMNTFFRKKTFRLTRER